MLRLRRSSSLAACSSRPIWKERSIQTLTSIPATEKQTTLENTPIASNLTGSCQIKTKKTLITVGISTAGPKRLGEKEKVSKRAIFDAGKIGAQ